MASDGSDRAIYDDVTARLVTIAEYLRLIAPGP